MPSSSLRRLPRDVGWPVILGGSAIVVSFLIRLATLGQPLIEQHAFRQTQTAYVAVQYHRDGIDLLRTPLPIFGPPWDVPFEFPLFQGIAALVMDLGIGTEVSLRATSLTFFVVSAGLVWRIVRDELDSRTAAVAVVAFLLAPLGLVWSRTSTIETIAVAAALGAVFESLRWDRGGSRVHLAGAIGLAALAAMLKITTAAVWLVPAIFLMRRSRLASLAVVAAGAVAGVAWTAYADSIKAMSPQTDLLTSAAYRGWTLGTIAQRLDPETWRVCLAWLGGLGLIVVVSPLVARRTRIGAWSLTTLILGPLVFTNLYVTHDYYWMAVAPAAAILIGLIVREVDSVSDGSRRRLWYVAIVGVFAVSYLAYPNWTKLYSPAEPGVLTTAAALREKTQPDELIALCQADWSPAVLFYADRRGFIEFPGSFRAPDEYTRFGCPDP